MNECRKLVSDLIASLGFSQAELVRRINAEGIYRVNSVEMCNALNGSITTPKANRIVADCYSILTREKEKADRRRIRERAGQHPDGE